MPAIPSNKVIVRKNSTGSTYRRRRLNFIEGSNVTLTVTDDPTDNEIDVTIASSGSGSSSGDFYTNALINGNFDVWQRNTTFTTPNDDTYIADRWIALVETSGSWTFSRSTDVPSTKSRFSLKCVNVTLNNQCAIVQLLEQIDATKLTGQTVSVSFQAKTTTSKVISNLRATILAWTGTADQMTSDVIGTWASDGTDPTWATSYTSEKAGSNLALTTSWQTFTVENISLDTASTNNLALVIWTDDGTIAATDEFYITQAQINVGTTALAYQPKFFADELARCRRYYRLLTSTQTSHQIGNGSAASTTIALIFVPFGVQMRIEPTLIVDAASDWKLDDGSGSVDVTGLSIQSGRNGIDGLCLRVTVASGLTQFRPYQFIDDGTGSRKIAFDAEL